MKCKNKTTNAKTRKQDLKYDIHLFLLKRNKAYSWLAKPRTETAISHSTGKLPLVGAPSRRQALAKLDSRATRWGIPVGKKKIPIITPQEFFELFLLPPPPALTHISVENYHIGMNLHLCWRHNRKEAFPKIPGQCKVSFTVLGPWECIFKLFLLKNGHRSVENYHTGKNLHLWWRLPVRSFFLKYQCNARLPSSCLASENAFLSYFYSKNSHNSVENHHIRIKFKLVPKTTRKKFS